MPAHLCRATDRNLVHTTRQLPLHAHDAFNIFGIQRRLGGIQIGFRYFAFAPAGFLDLCEYFSHGRSELFLVAHTTDVHEHDLRRIPEKMIVKRSHVQAVVQRHTHYRIDLVFEQSGITHNHRLAVCIHKRGIGGQAHSRVHLHSRCSHLKIRPWGSDSEHSLFFVHLSLTPVSCSILAVSSLAWADM